MKYLWLVALVVVAGCSPSQESDSAKDSSDKSKSGGYEWEALFDGKTLSGWTAPDPGEWKMEDGILKGTGTVSHLFSPNQYTNLEFKAEV
jgi:hypothetical protein